MSTCTLTISHTNRPFGQPDSAVLTVANGDAAAAAIILTVSANFQGSTKTQNKIEVSMPYNTAYAEGALGAGTGNVGVGATNFIGTYGTMITHGNSAALSASFMSVSGTLQVELMIAIVNLTTGTGFIECLVGTSVIAPT
jgi:hypothetical protein